VPAAIADLFVRESVNPFVMTQPFGQRFMKIVFVLTTFAARWPE
jgi:hypothetical protein